MSNLKNRKSHDFEKPFLGCMGKMVKLFDLSPGMAGNRLLTEKSHQDGSLLKGRADVTKKVLDPIRDQMEEKHSAMWNMQVEYELKRSSSDKKSNRTPVKMLIAQELSKETEPKRKPPTVVAKLMGLDVMPALQPVSTLEKSLPEGHVQNVSTKPGSIPRYPQQDRSILDKQAHCDVYPSQAYIQEKAEYKDVYEVWQQSSKINHIEDQLRQKDQYKENSNEKKMALVRQKFIEAKRLATDEKLRQSKEFQDALEVLSSNRDLFLKFLQEPNSLFSKHLNEVQSTSPPQTKNITVLKPSMVVETSQCVGIELKSNKQIKKQHQAVEANHWDKYKAGWDFAFDHQRTDNTSQPTRIVVLKPCLGKTHDINAVVSSLTSSPILTHSRDFYGDSESSATRESREIAKEITQQMRESLSSDRIDKAFLSSMLSNGYVGDESSFNHSENDYIDDGNLSDLETMSPISRHSWDYMNRYSSRYSSSSFSRASYSQESSVTREAKKRLSERLAMMSSTGSSQEQRQIRRSSSTLGEMLTLTDIKKPVRSGEENNDGEPCVSSSWLCSEEQELRGQVARLSTSGEESPRTLSRSRSVPASSTAYKVKSNVEVPDPEVGKSIVPKELGKPESGKMSLKGKVSSLFFSRKKKPSKEKCSLPLSVGSPDGYHSNTDDMPGTPPEIKQLSVANRSDVAGSVMMDGACEEGHSLNPGGSSCKPLSPYIWAGSKWSTFPSEAVLSLAKAGEPENSSENQDQPSPISVLEAPFEDDVNTHSKIVKTCGQELSEHLHRHESESTAKSPIDTITRSLSWDDGSLESSTANRPEPSTTSSRAESEEKEDHFLFVRMLISSAGLENERSDTVYSKWHSPMNPLDPLLLDKFMKGEEYEQQQNEAKRRQWRSERRLLFDCVNVALVDMEESVMSRSRCKRVPLAGAPVMEEVCGRLKEWFSGETNLYSGESDATSVVERVVRKEVAVGNGWVDQIGVEVDRIGKEIEGELLEELVEEALLVYCDT